jgi:hypothetical protein
MKALAITTIVGLLLTAMPVFACIGPGCDMPNDGSIDTYFYGEGKNVWFNDALYIDEHKDPDVIIENVWTDKGSVSVLQNINIEDGWFFSPTEVVLNKQITVDPASFWIFSYDANVEKYVSWDGEGEVYREATLGDVTDIVSVGADEGTFIDNIQYKGTVNVFESVGLNRGTICYLHDVVMPKPPVCTLCI